MKNFVLQDDVLIFIGPQFPGTKKAALELSIEKWKTIVDLKKAKHYVTDGGVATCALCKLYYNWPSGDACVDCPVADYTGRTCCEATPYNKYVRTGTLSAAKEELAFLRKVQKAQTP